MTTLAARAPGKLFLLGEYAVLDGAPALVAGVDRGVEVHLTRRGTGTVRIDAGNGDAALEFDAGRPPQHPPLRFALAAYAEALAVCPRLASSGLTLTIRSELDGHGTSDAPAKLGLGSSAAVTVAITAALLAAGGLEAGPRQLQEAVFPLACRAHRRAQGDVGSGADVAASTFGGVVQIEPRRQAPPRTNTLTLPSWAILLAAWTGTGASTGPLVRQYEALPWARRADFVRLSRGSVEWFAASLRQHALSLTAVDAAGNALAHLANSCGLPLFTPSLRSLVTIAREHGAAAKPSGAGGGDCGIAVTANAAAAERIRAGWRAAGLQPLDLGVSATGVTVVAA